MKSVSIAKLKDNLSQYLEEVERGEEIIVRNRKRPVAVIVRPQVKETEEEQSLVIEGKLRLPLKEATPNFWKAFWSTAGIKASPFILANAVMEDRNEER
jgi:prevent-host-death family protein